MATLEEQINEHISDFSNPHNVTKEQVNLMGVANYPLATAEEAEQGDVAERYVTPALLKHVFNGVLKREGLMSPEGNVILQ